MENTLLKNAHFDTRYSIVRDLVRGEALVVFPESQVGPWQYSVCFNPGKMESYFNVLLTSELIYLVDHGSRRHTYTFPGSSTWQFSIQPDLVSLGGSTPNAFFHELWTQFRQASLDCLRQKAFNGYFDYCLQTDVNGTVTAVFPQAQQWRRDNPQGTPARIAPACYLELFVNELLRPLGPAAEMAERLQKQTLPWELSVTAPDNPASIEIIDLWEGFVWLGKKQCDDFGVNGAGCLVPLETFQAILEKCRAIYCTKETKLSGSPWEYTITTDRNACLVTVDFPQAKEWTVPNRGFWSVYTERNSQFMLQAILNEGISDGTLCAIDRLLPNPWETSLCLKLHGHYLVIQKEQDGSYRIRWGRFGGTINIPGESFSALWQDYRQARLVCLRQKAAHGYYSFTVKTYAQTGFPTVAFDAVSRQLSASDPASSRLKHALGLMELYAKNYLRTWYEIYQADQLSPGEEYWICNPLSQRAFPVVNYVAYWEDFVWISGNNCRDPHCLVSTEVFRSIVGLYKDAYLEKRLAHADPDRFRHFTYRYTLQRDPWNRSVDIRFPQKEAPALQLLVQALKGAASERPLEVLTLPDLGENTWLYIGCTEAIVRDDQVWLCSSHGKLPDCMIPLPILRHLLEEYNVLWEECLAASNQPGQDREYSYSAYQIDGHRWMRPECPTDPVLYMVSLVCEDIPYILWHLKACSNPDDRCYFGMDSERNPAYFAEVPEDGWVRIGALSETPGEQRAVCLPIRVLEEIQEALIHAPDVTYDLEEEEEPEPEEAFLSEEDLPFYGKTDPHGYPRNAAGKKKYRRSRNRIGKNWPPT